MAPCPPNDLRPVPAQRLTDLCPSVSIMPPLLPQTHEEAVISGYRRIVLAGGVFRLDESAGATKCPTC